MSAHSVDILSRLLLPPILWIFLTGGIFSFLVGVGLIAAGPKTLRFFQTMNQWVSLRQSTKPMSVQRDIWPTLQRFRIPFALLLILAAALSAFTLIYRIDTQALAIVVGIKFNLPTAFVAWIAGGVRWFLIGGSVLGIVIGIMLALAPNSLKMIEQGAGRSYSTRELGREAEVMRFTLDNWVASHTRTSGWIIVLVALIEVIDVASLLFRLPATH
ncbi:hypothetical protein BH11PSE11_BH11PSE11_07950 [soil metagenome]